MSELLFVYGSLMAESQHEMATYLKQYAKILRRGYIKGRLYKIAWYPGAIDDPESDYKVWGSLIKVSQAQKVFEALDEYEGYSPHAPSSSLFIRKKVNVIVDKDVLSAWFYAYNHPLDGFPLVESGDFLGFMTKEG